MIRSSLRSLSESIQIPFRKTRTFVPELNFNKCVPQESRWWPHGRRSMWNAFIAAQNAQNWEATWDGPARTISRWPFRGQPFMPAPLAALPSCRLTLRVGLRRLWLKSAPSVARLTCYWMQPIIAPDLSNKEGRICPEKTFHCHPQFWANHRLVQFLVHIFNDGMTRFLRVMVFGRNGVPFTRFFGHIPGAGQYDHRFRVRYAHRFRLNPILFPSPIQPTQIGYALVKPRILPLRPGEDFCFLPVPPGKSGPFRFFLPGFSGHIVTASVPPGASPSRRCKP